MAKKSKNYWGFDTRDIDTKVRPQDDFYRYANGGWLKKNKIPAEESRWGSFTTLRYKTEHQLKDLVESTKNRQVGAMYRSASDMAVRNKLGIKPLTLLRAQIRTIDSVEKFLERVAQLHVLGVSCLWGGFVDQDSKDSTKYILHLWQDGLSLPDRDYYLLDKPEQKRVQEAYVRHVQRLLKLAGFPQAVSKRIETSVIKIETLLAKASMSKEDIRDPHKIYHKLSLKQLQTLAPQVNWKEYFKRTHVGALKNCIVGQPEFLKEAAKLLQSIPLEAWQDYLEFHLINGSAGALSEPFIKENFNFYGRVLTGTKKMRPLWRRALGATNATLADLVGELYVKKYFPRSAKKTMDTLVSDLFDVYEERIKKLDWMSPATKRKAIKKLRVMSRKIGYPSKWKSYRGLRIIDDDYFGNLQRSSAYEHDRQMKKLRGPVDRTEWFMSPQTVNAYFAPNLNDIVFPAAILQWPFFDPKADAAVNYAGIGSVIGHEMTHGFDDQGAKFDEKGNLHDWWTASDRKRFEKKGKLAAQQYSAYEVAPGITVNGKLTLGENIADFGGLSIAWDAYQKHIKKSGRTLIDGLTPEQRFFLGYAQMERELVRPEYVKMQVLTDPHSPAICRINGPLSNFKPFYGTFELKKGDKLFRDSKVRAEIW